MTTVSGTFTGGAKSSYLNIGDVPQVLDYALTGGTWTTPGAGISLQREAPAGGEGWVTVAGPFTADASGAFQTGANERYRWLSALTSGSVPYTLSDRDQTLLAIKDRAGNSVVTYEESGADFPTRVTSPIFADASGDLGATMAELTRAADLSARIVSATAATLEVTEAAHEGRTVVLNRSGGITVTLPAATGSGARYRFVVGTVSTTGYVISSVVGTDLMEGVIIGASTTDSATDAARTWLSGATDDTVTLNGTTKGGVAVGDWVEFEDISATGWAVRGMVTQSGTEASPFSDAVA